MKIISKSLAETGEFAEKFLKDLAPSQGGATVVGLYGDLGSGKTTFVQAVGRVLGITESMQSPTFVIIKSYSLSVPYSIRNTQYAIRTLIHIDAYRLESGKELRKLGFEELLTEPKNLIFLEWPENVIEVLPNILLTIKFSFIDEATRTMEYRKM